MRLDENPAGMFGAPARKRVQIGLDLAARFQEDVKGATAVEYGLMVGFISLAIVATLLSIGQDIGTAFTIISDALQGS
ncbi:Flp family type IVb pilin [Pannonibacter sp. Pt2-lr]|uniref:Flp family type IVb pilin n=1 Tax=Pannonibacter anstelovis TaxID=3121537 RepID=A0ABU7ZQT0_9HYPH